MALIINLRHVNLLLCLLILLSIFTQSKSILSFNYLQSTTIDGGYILVVEKNGIYKCDPSFNNIITTLYTFSEEDKINSESKLSKTFIKKSSVVIIILSNYKLYLVKNQNGVLTYKSTNKIITEEPNYLTVAYVLSNSVLYFIIGYIDNNNYLNLKYYKTSNTYNNINLLNSLSLNSIYQKFSSGYRTLNFQNKGLSCDYMKSSYFACFLIGNYNSKDYLIPVTFYDSNNKLTLEKNKFTMPDIEVTDCMQIKSDTNADMSKSYVCYVTADNIGRCSQFSLSSNTGTFAKNSNKEFEKNCRADIYGMKVAYIFETKDIIFSCSDLDGSLQVYIFGNTEKQYIKYNNCNNIIGFSIISLANENKRYYVTSDVTCPEGKIPLDVLEESDDYTPQIVTIVDTIKKESILDRSDNENIISKSNGQITDKIIEEITESVKNNDNFAETEKLTNFISSIDIDKEKIIERIDNRDNSQLINIDINDVTSEINDCPEMCFECNTENKCIRCNKNEGYYEIELVSISQVSNQPQQIECINEEIKQIKYPNFYLDSETETFKPCYEKCDTCYGKGDGKDNNCKTCESGYIFHPDYENSTNCVPEPNSLYYIKNGQYTTTNSDKCPEDYNYLIKEKNKCIEECIKDSKYKYTYDGLCYEEQPENTIVNDTTDLICKDNPNKCIATKKELYTINDTITNEEIETLTSIFAQEYNYTNNHISIYENNIYIITIYKNGECITELGITSKIIDFGNCYTDIQINNSISQNQSLIIVNIETKEGKELYKINPSYGLYHPQTGKSLNYEKECKEQKVIVQNNLTKEFNNSKVNLDDIKLMAEEGLDLFDIMSPFYNDLCTHYPDVLNKDIPLKKRILAYYPDIKLCDDNCDLIYVFLNNLTSKCNCLISEDNNKKDNIYKNKNSNYDEYNYITNINVVKCYKDIFKYKYLIKNYGAFIILTLIIIQIICTLIYCTKSILILKKFFYIIINRYLYYLKTKDTANEISPKSPLVKSSFIKINIPPKKKCNIQTSNNTSVKVFKKENNLNLLTNNNLNTKKNIIITYNNNNKEKLNSDKTNRIGSSTKFETSKKTKIMNDNPKVSCEQKFSDFYIPNIANDLNINIEEYLETNPDDMNFDDAMNRDKRTFCVYYLEKIKSQHIISNTFFYNEYLRPRPIKIMVFVLQIEFYFFINGLLYNEEYIDKIFELEKDTFLKKTLRFLNNLFYSLIVGIILHYILEYFFVQEKQIRITLKTEKDNLPNLKYEMIQTMKDILKRFIILIIISFITSVFILYYISCFNNVYPHMKKEWIIFSVFVVLCVLFLSLVKSLIETILRFLSFKFKSEKLFKLSLLFS